MLKDLQKYFANFGWYTKTRKFIIISFEGGFESFSGKASETWEYRWTILIPEHEDLNIPQVLIHGNREDSLDDVAAKALKKLEKIKEDHGDATN